MRLAALGILLAVAALPAAAADSPVVTLAAVGDVLLARGPAKQIDKHGAAWLFGKCRAVLTGADLAFCNLESCLSTRGVPQKAKFRFRADPKLADALVEAGFDVISLANNHTLDYGRDTLTDTIACLEKAGLTTVGAGANLAQSHRLRVVERQGLRIGSLAYTDVASEGCVRTSSKPTVAAADEFSLPAQVRNAAAACDALVVSFHWGQEYMKLPTQRQRVLARLCIDNGAAAVLGHHPHVLQAVETYKDRPIIYSMGGFVWDSRLMGADRSAIYVLELTRTSSRLLKTIPLRVINCQPVPR